jgi:hypothetical protein
MVLCVVVVPCIAWPWPPRRLAGRECVQVDVAHDLRRQHQESHRSNGRCVRVGWLVVRGRRVNVRVAHETWRHAVASTSATGLTELGLSSLPHNFAAQTCSSTHTNTCEHTHKHTVQHVVSRDVSLAGRYVHWVRTYDTATTTRYSLIFYQVTGEGTPKLPQVRVHEPLLPTGW